MRSITLLLPLLVFATSSYGDDEPSNGARGIPGALGSFEYKPDDWMEGKKLGGWIQMESILAWLAVTLGLTKKVCRAAECLAKLACRAGY